MTWQLRRARPGDVDGIMQLETSIFVNDAWSNGMMTRDIADPSCYYLVAFGPDTPENIVAYAGMLAPKGAVEGDIQTIAVAPSARRSGLGRTLIQTLMSEAWRRGAREMFLEVRADNPEAQRLYARLGFEDVGVRRGYYQPDGVDAIVMRARIDDPVTMPATMPATDAAAEPAREAE